MPGFYKAFIILSLISTQFANAQWVSQITGLQGPKTINSLSVANANTLWISSNEGFPFELTRDFARTIDGGSNWSTGTVCNDTNLYINQLYGMDAQNAWACLANASDTGGYIYHTSDGGLNWVRQDSAVFHRKPVLLHFWDEDTGVCIGNPYDSYFEIYTTVNGGEDWEAVPEYNMPGALDDHYIVHQSFYVKGDTIYFSGYLQGRIFASYDHGNNWVIIPFPANTVSYLAFTDSTGFGAHLDLTNNDYQLFKSLDYGQTWTKQAAANFTDSYRICFVPGTPGTFISAGLDNLMVSNNWGDSWALLEGPAVNPSPYYSCIQFIDNKHGWLAGEVNSNSVGGVYKYDGPALEVPGINDNPAQFAIYPNPASENLTIELNPERSMPVKAEFMEISGKIVREWNFNTTSNLTQYTENLQGIQSGIYILKLSIGETVSFNRLIVK